MSPTTTVIFNPKSANGRTGRRQKALAAAIRAAIGPFHALASTAPGHATQLARQALRDGCTRIISVGGDGTHAEVANGFFTEQEELINPAAAMGILPHGTGNDLPRNLGIPRNFARALPALRANRISKVDLGRIQFTDFTGAPQTRYFQNTCHIGLGPEIGIRVNSNTKILGGFCSFLYATISALARYKGHPIRIQYNDSHLETWITEIIIAKGRYAAGGMLFAPQAKLDDAHFHVCLIGRLSPLNALRNLHLLYTGRAHTRPDLVTTFQTDQICITSPECVKVAIDGEVPGRLPAALRVSPRALPIIIGPDCPVGAP